MAIEPQPAALAVVEEQWGDLAAQARALVVVDRHAWEVGCGLLTALKQVLRAIDAAFQGTIDAGLAAHRAALAARDGFKEPRLAAFNELKTKVAEWERQEERRLAEERRVAEAAARKEAEDRAMREAEALAAQGHTAAAEAVLTRSLDVQPVFVPEAPKAVGISFPTWWTFRIVNRDAIPRQYMAVNEVAIGKVVRALGMAANIPGVEVYETVSVRVA